jgi:5'-nucleotidase
VPGEGTDLDVLARKCVSVTPLRLDLTDLAFSRTLADVLKDRAPH